MRQTHPLPEQIELAHRRLLRAKRLIEDGLMTVAQTTQGPLYLCQSQTGQEKPYVVDKDACPCEDKFQLDGQKLCKHVLARLILETNVPLTKIGQDPMYWEKDGPTLEHARESPSSVT